MLDSTCTHIFPTGDKPAPRPHLHICVEWACLRPIVGPWMFGESGSCPAVPCKAKCWFRSLIESSKPCSKGKQYYCTKSCLCLATLLACLAIQRISIFTIARLYKAHTKHSGKADCRSDERLARPLLALAPFCRTWPGTL